MSSEILRQSLGPGLSPCAQKVSKALVAVAIAVGEVWLCLAHPWLVVGAVLVLFVGGGVLFLVAELFSPREPKPAGSGSVFAALILGVLLGWWLGGGDGDCG